MSSRLALMLSLTALLSACSSSAPALNYYTLGGSDAARVASVDEALPTLVLESLTLAEYLEQSGLVLQQGPHQLQVSRNHLWAENLDVAVPEVLLASLQTASPEFRYFVRGRDFIPSVNYSLRLHLDAFHATEAGDVVASGRYQVVDMEGSREIINRQFNFTNDLQRDGYPQVVSQLRALLQQLAGSIVSELQNAR